VEEYRKLFGLDKEKIIPPLFVTFFFFEGRDFLPKMVKQFSAVEYFSKKK